MSSYESQCFYVWSQQPEMAGKLRRAMAWLEQKEGYPKKSKITTDRDHNDSIPSNALIVKLIFLNLI